MSYKEIVVLSPAPSPPPRRSFFNKLNIFFDLVYSAVQRSKSSNFCGQMSFCFKNVVNFLEILSIFTVVFWILFLVLNFIAKISLSVVFQKCCLVVLQVKLSLAYLSLFFFFVTPSVPLTVASNAHTVLLYSLYILPFPIFILLFFCCSVVKKQDFILFFCLLMFQIQLFVVVFFFVYGAELELPATSSKCPPKNAGLVVFGFELKLFKFSVLLLLF